MPFILLLLKLCKHFGIEHEMIKALQYNDLLALIVEMQIDEIQSYLNSKNPKKDEEIELTPQEATMFLCGKLPKGKEVNNHERRMEKP